MGREGFTLNLDFETGRIGCFCEVSFGQSLVKHSNQLVIIE